MELLKPTELSGIKVLSLDVFDTSLLRSVARPEDLFVEVHRICATQTPLPVSPQRFQRLRVHAEALARQQRADREVTLDEIHAQLQLQTQWSDELIEAIKNGEIAAELATARPNPIIAQAISMARSAGIRIVFVSDMYLPSETIGAMLDSCGLMKAEDTLLVSAEHRKSKANGGLYKVLLDSFHVEPSQILHIGDNAHSDHAMAKRNGINSIHYRDLQLSELERHRLSFHTSLENIPSLISGASRAARVAPRAESIDQGLHELGCTLLGPILSSFVLWVFAKAKARGLKRLYFVSRDGQVMLSTALALQKVHPELNDIECRYLYGSRIAWHLGALSSFSERQLHWLLSPQPLINAATLCKRLQIPTGVLSAAFEKMGHASLLSAHSWSANEIKIVRTVLQESENELLSHPAISERRRLATEYLRQEGLTDISCPWGLVELGWIGSMLSSLQECLGNQAPIEAFYLCHAADDKYLPVEVRLESFLTQPKGAQDYFLHQLRHAEIIEALTAADHATVLGYEKKPPSSYVPVLKTDTRNIWNSNDLTSLRSGVAAFIAELQPDTIRRISEAVSTESHTALLAHMHLACIAELLRCPPPRLAMPFTRCNFSEDPADENRRPFISPLSFGEALKPARRRATDLWFTGSVSISSTLNRSFLERGLITTLRIYLMTMTSHGVRRLLGKR